MSSWDPVIRQVWQARSQLQEQMPPQELKMVGGLVKKLEVDSRLRAVRVDY
jgi:hypothetical protein